MLRFATVACFLVSVGAWAQDDDRDDGLKRLQQLTVGISDQFLGQLAPDGHTLYFVSNRNTVSEIYKQDVDEARATVVFEEHAEVTWPRVSPDGKRLLYISFQTQAAGQLCVRDLPSAEGRRCLEDGGIAMQAEWMGNDQIALVSRASIASDFRLIRVSVGRTLSGKVRLEKNLTGPAVSPDGRWLVYLPVERYVEQVGSGFAASAASQLEALRLDGNGPPIPLHLNLPGLTGQPAFAQDGQTLYVAQFFADSNHDGLIDANDHGVLFRILFPSEKDDAPALAAAATPVQLTDSSWNCQYPAPAKKLLIVTCSRRSALGVFSLPLEGRVPPEWSLERIRAEADQSPRSSEQLLLLRHLLTKETTTTGRRTVMMKLIRLHLRQDELAPAELYVEQVSAVKDPSTAGIASGLRTLLAHRRAAHERATGQLQTDFAAGVRQRMKEFVAKPGWAPVARAFAHLVQSELADALGDFAQAREELERVKLEDVTLPTVLRAYFDRAESLYRRLDERDAWVRACRRLATHPILTSDQRLPYARAAVRAEIRGLSFAEAQARLSQPGEDELAFARRLENALLGIRSTEPSEAVVSSVLKVYSDQTQPVRRRWVMMEATQRADEVGADAIVEALAEHYLEDVKPGTDEGRRAVRLYHRVFLARAYRRSAQQKLEEARADFESVGRRTQSLEGYMGAINTQARLGAKPDQILARYADVQPPEIAAFIKTYVASREIPKLRGAEHEKAIVGAIAGLRPSWNKLKGKAEARALFGSLQHERFLDGGDRAAAQRANVHYLIALDLVRSNVRQKAMVLGQLALLQSQVENHRIALGFLDEREKLPYPDNGAALAVRLARARSLFHVGEYAKAAKTADEAVAMVGRKERLAEYRVLALDRAALYHLAAGEFEKALSLYDLELPLVDAAKSDRNLLTVRLGHAAAALGAGRPQETLNDLAWIDVRLAGPNLLAGLEWPHVSDKGVLRAYRLIAAGLRANAQTALGRFDQTEAALQRRRALLIEQFKDAPDVIENVRALTLVNAQLADNAVSQEDHSQTGAYLLQALTHADIALRKNGAPIDADTLVVLSMAAELKSSGEATLPFNLAPRLRTAHDALLKDRDTTRRTSLRRFEVYRAVEDSGALLREKSAPRQKPKNEASGSP